MQTVAKLADTAMKVRDYVLIRTGFAPETIRAEVSGRAVRFHVATPTELHRARSLAGEREVLERLLADVEAGMTVWDVGAAVGTATCFLATVADVRAFEPHPGNATRLRENLALNGLDATVDERALSDREYTGRLAVTGGTATGTHRLDRSEGDERIDVECVRADALPEVPDVVKIDVEGHEVEVLDGFGERLSEVQSVMIECHPQHGVRLQDVRSRLTEAGLDVETIATDRRETFVHASRSDDGAT